MAVITRPEKDFGCGPAPDTQKPKKLHYIHVFLNLIFTRGAEDTIEKTIPVTVIWEGLAQKLKIHEKTFSFLLKDVHVFTLKC